jgi:hypothetical protein
MPWQHDGASASRSCHPSVQGQTRRGLPVPVSAPGKKQCLVLGGVPLPPSGVRTDDDSVSLMRARRAPDQAPTCMGPWGWRGPGAVRGSVVVPSSMVCAGDGEARAES